MSSASCSIEMPALTLRTLALLATSLSRGMLEEGTRVILVFVAMGFSGAGHDGAGWKPLSQPLSVIRSPRLLLLSTAVAGSWAGPEEGRLVIPGAARSRARYRWRLAAKH